LKILISDPVAEECVEILRTEGLQVDLRPGLSQQDLKKIIGEYAALIVRSGTKVTAELIEAAERLRVIGRAGAGVDNVDVGAATRRGIIVMNTPGGNTISTAEHAFSLLLALSRNIPQASWALKRGEWERSRYTGVELYGKTLGIIGVGKVGGEVARRAIAFGMAVIGYDPFLSEEIAEHLGVELVDLDELYMRSDYISIHASLTDETKNLLSDEAFDKCKHGVRLINCARGEIVDQKALLRAIDSGRVAGAALDVFQHEPPRGEEIQLIERPEVIATPHLGASTKEAQVSVALQIARQVADALLDRTVQNAVNLPSLPAGIYEKIRPYLYLAEKIGSLHAQLGEGRLLRITIEYYGDVLNYPTSPITSGVLKGVMDRICGGRVNYVNAPIFAQQRGVRVDEIRSSEHRDFLTLINVIYVTDKGQRAISGTIFGKNDPRIVRIDDCRIDAHPEGEVLICLNEDIPGVIGKIGTILGNRGINIGRMAWGRIQADGRAMTLLNLDNPVTDEVVTEIASLPYVIWVKKVKL
jgi:D-3-phosphoglycerate dehydrogenase